MTRAVGSEGKGIQCIQGRAPLGSLGCCQAQRGLVLVVTCFVLDLMFRPAQEISIDTEIEISRRLSLEKGPKKGQRLPLPASMYVLARGADIFSNVPFQKNFQTLPHPC